ncbi:hypothetical protein EVG20_g3561 [Dentipellis fragilis]|uniref:Uncharacterized protein n=1 Tax=Dentipellis fragilis TaxID=205917 RepID=A0A4Y9Z379_9AGAM|nr:hypothetical protein EVG20_g3561 [Dentipellis fragilis]
MSLLSARFPSLYIQHIMLSNSIAPFGSPGEHIAVLALASLLYGTFCVVYGSSTYLLLWNEGFKSRARFIMFVVTTVMFCIATAHWSVLLAFTWILETRLLGGHGLVAPKDVRLLVDMDDFLSFTPAINMLFSDAIVFWRAWLIYGHRSGVLRLFSSLLVPALTRSKLTTMHTAMAILSAAGSQYPIRLNANMSLSIFAAIIFGFLTTAINILSTGLIAWKTWQHQQSIRNHLKLVDRRTQVERILALLVELGLLYSAASLACSIIIATRPGSPEFVSYRMSTRMRQTLRKTQSEVEIIDLSVLEESRKQSDCSLPESCIHHAVTSKRFNASARNLLYAACSSGISHEAKVPELSSLEIVVPPHTQPVGNTSLQGLSIKTARIYASQSSRDQRAVVVPHNWFGTEPRRWCMALQTYLVMAWKDQGSRSQRLRLGAFSVIFAFSAYFVFWKEGLNSRPRLIMLVLITAMYIVATAHFSLLIAFAYILDTKGLDCHGGIKRQYATQLGNIQGTLTFLPMINYLLSDAIVVWRAWLVCEHRLKVMFPSLILLALTLAAALVSVVVFETRASGDAVLKIDAISLNAGVAFCFLAILNNMWSTGVIAWTAWQHRKSIREHLSFGNRRSQVEKILVMLIESGALYCCCMIVYGVNLAAKTDPLNNSIVPILVQISGIYPTVVVLLACLQKTHCDRNFKYDCDIEAPQFIRNYEAAGRTFVTTQNEIQTIEVSVFDVAKTRSMESKVEAGELSR